MVHILFIQCIWTDDGHNTTSLLNHLYTFHIFLNGFHLQQCICFHPYQTCYKNEKCDKLDLFASKKVTEFDSNLDCILLVALYPFEIDWLLFLVNAEFINKMLASVKCNMCIQEKWDFLRTETKNARLANERALFIIEIFICRFMHNTIKYIWLTL